MFGKNNRKGFTLIEMLVVISIIAVLVVIIIPAVNQTTVQAKAATDAANLRSILATLNINVISGDQTVDQIIDESLHPISQMDPDATLCVVYNEPGFIDVYYVNQSTSTYYGLDYLSDYATNGSSSLSTAEPAVPSGSVWYTVQGE